jgi:peptidase M50-like protein
MSESSQAPEAASGGEKPLEITTFYPESVEVLDRRPRRVAGTYYRPQSFGTNKPLAAALLLATCVSVFLSGLIPGDGIMAAAAGLEYALHAGNFWAVLWEMLPNGIIYFAALMTILMSHEMGHYLQAKRYRVPANGPYFIPFPVTPIGTMGAVIIQGAGIADRKSMFDIAISGPLAGLIFAIPVTIVGVLKSKVAEVDPTGGVIIFNDPLIIQWISRWIHGPMPLHHELQLNAWLFAGWVGIFITALNLMPIGQLDGGHILYTLIGRRAHAVALGLLFAAMAYMIRTRQLSYIAMVVLLFLAGPRHPPTADDGVPLGAGRMILGWLTLCFLFLGFTLDPVKFLPLIERPKEGPRQQQQQPSNDAIEVRLAPRGDRQSGPARLTEETCFAQTSLLVGSTSANLVKKTPSSVELGEGMTRFRRTW